MKEIKKLADSVVRCAGVGLVFSASLHGDTREIGYAIFGSVLLTAVYFGWVASSLESQQKGAR